MCGIAGIIRSVGLSDTDRLLLERMTDSISHRGPDGSGYYISSQVGLGHRRLAIIDIHEGQQPLYNEDDSVVVVFNGEIYNFATLRKELEAAGHIFKTNSDTEVIVHGWEEWGSDCVSRFQGMFAFVLHDTRNDLVFAARDRIGIKPFYYAYNGTGELLFASELKALECYDALDRTLDVQAVEDYFAYGYIPDPKTIYTSVRKLEPGHALLYSCDAKTLRLKQYWDLTDADTQVTSIEDTAVELMERLEASISAHLVSDVPLGAFLSGGVDSSAVVAVMAGLRADPIRTTSIGFNEAEFDESEYAQRIVDRYGCDHTLERVTSTDLCMLDSLAQVYDEPYADSSALPTLALCKATRKQVTVALSGDGGDELFAGYRGYRLHLAKEKIRRAVPAVIRRSLFHYLGLLYPRYDSLPAYLRAKTTFQTLALDSCESYAWGSMITTPTDRKNIFTDRFFTDLQGYSAFEVARTVAKKAPVTDPLKLAQYMDFKLYLPGDILTKVDRASMVHGLEVRVPILDHPFVEWGFGLPADLKLRDGIGKYIFKHALKDYVDESILYRPKKGFSIPLKSWLRGPLYKRLESCITEGRIVESGIIERKRARVALDQFTSGSCDHSALLWSIVLLEQFFARD